MLRSMKILARKYGRKSPRKISFIRCINCESFLFFFFMEWILLQFFSDDPRGNARVLREDVGAIVYLIDAGGQGDPEQNLAVVGESNPHRIVSLNEWRGSDSETIGAIADELCEVWLNLHPLCWSSKAINDENVGWGLNMHPELRFYSYNSYK